MPANDKPSELDPKMSRLRPEAEGSEPPTPRALRRQIERERRDDDE